MKAINRALTSIKRQYLKFAILFLTVFLIGGFGAASIILRSSINNVHQAIRNEMRPLIRIAIDDEALYNHWIYLGGGWEETDEGNWRLISDIAHPRPTKILPEHISNLRNHNLVETVHHSISLGFMTPLINPFNKYIPSFNTTLQENCVLMPIARIEGEPTPCFEESKEYFFGLALITGYYGKEPLEMQEGLIEVTIGVSAEETQQLNGYYPLVISEKIALENGLTIGSVISFTDRIFSRDEVTTWEEFLIAEKTFDFKIVGLFEIFDQHDEDSTREAFRKQRLSQYFYTNIDALISIQEFRYYGNLAADEASDFQNLPVQDGNTEIVLTILLKDYSYLDEFLDTINNYIPEFWTGIPVQNNFANILNSFASLTNIVNLILIGSLIAMSLVLYLLIKLFLKDRNKEIGVLLALGEKKYNIIKHIILENLIISSLALVMAIYVGNILLSHITNNIIFNFIFSTSTPSVNTFDFGGTFQNSGFGGYLSPDEIMTILDNSIDILPTLIFLVGGLIIIFIATIFSAIRVMKIKVKDILS